MGWDEELVEGKGGRREGDRLDVGFGCSAVIVDRGMICMERCGFGPFGCVPA